MENTLLQYGVPTLKRILRGFTNKKWKSVISGTILASITQSSTIVSVMTVVFVGAGIVTLASGVGVIIGANVGSTLLGIVLGGAMAGSIKLSSFALPMLAAGAIGELFFKKKKKIYFVTMLLLSFGLIFYGISLINGTVSAYAMSIDMAVINQRGILGYFLIGVLLTAMMHSSDTMLVLALSFLAQGVIGLPEAIAIMIGANIGTTISAIEGSRGGSKEQKQVALSHFLFNVISAIIALPLLGWSIQLVDFFFDLPKQNIWAVVIYDFWYNVLGALLFYPFMKQYVWLLERLVSPKKDELVLRSTSIDAEHLKEAVADFRQDTMLLLDKVITFNLQVLNIDPKKLKLVDKKLLDEEKEEQSYNVIRTIEETLMQTVISLYKTHKTHTRYHTELFTLREAVERMVYSAKTLKDISHNLDELRASKMALLTKFLKEFAKESIDIYQTISRYREGEAEASHDAKLHGSLKMLMDADEHFLSEIGTRVSKELLANRNLSSLLHLSQGLNRSHKAMIHTIELLYNKDN